MIEALISGPLGVILGVGITYLQARRSARQAERDKLLAQMQALVLAVSDLDMARRRYEVQYGSRQAVWRAGFTSLAEFYSLWSSGGRSWMSVAGALGPVVRFAHERDQHSISDTREIILAYSRVGAAGLPLGMCDDSAIARAAQDLMDAAYDDRDQDTVREAVRSLRVAFYPEEATEADRASFEARDLGGPDGHANA